MWNEEDGAILRFVPDNGGEAISFGSGEGVLLHPGNGLLLLSRQRADRTRALFLCTGLGEDGRPEFQPVDTRELGQLRPVSPESSPHRRVFSSWVSGSRRSMIPSLAGWRSVPPRKPEHFHQRAAVLWKIFGCRLSRPPFQKGGLRMKTAAKAGCIVFARS